jgi:hypothetical protein
MKGQHLLIDLVKYVIPKELLENFELTHIQEEEEILHFHFDEINVIPIEYEGLGLLLNGFYESSTIKDFPLRDRKVILHIRRRRWVDDAGKSYSRDWSLVAEGTRYSKEFASFLKEAFGYLPDSCPIT